MTLVFAIAAWVAIFVAGFAVLWAFLENPRTQIVAYVFAFLTLIFALCWGYRHDREVLGERIHQAAAIARCLNEKCGPGWDPKGACFQEKIKGECKVQR